MKKCPKCGADIRIECPFCNEPKTKTEPKTKPEVKGKKK